MTTITGVENIHKRIEESLSRKMTEFEERLKTATTPPNLTITQLRDEFYTFKEIVSSMLNLLQQQIVDCVSNIDQMDMHRRRKALLFNGMTETPKEDLSQLVLLLLKEKMGLSEYSAASLKQCFRLGASHGNHPRPVLVYFHDHETKTNIWKMKSKLKGSGISVSEFLTKIRQSIHKTARVHFGVNNVWSFDGSIYIKHPEGRAKVTTREQLDALLARFPTVGPSITAVKSSSSNNDKKAIQVPLSHDVTQPKKSRRQQSSQVAVEDGRRGRTATTKK